MPSTPAAIVRRTCTCSLRLSRKIYLQNQTPSGMYLWFLYPITIRGYYNGLIPSENYLMISWLIGWIGYRWLYGIRKPQKTLLSGTTTLSWFYEQEGLYQLWGKRFPRLIILPISNPGSMTSTLASPSRPIGQVGRWVSCPIWGSS